MIRRKIFVIDEMLQLRRTEALRMLRSRYYLRRYSTFLANHVIGVFLIIEILRKVAYYKLGRSYEVVWSEKILQELFDFGFTLTLSCIIVGTHFESGYNGDFSRWRCICKVMFGPVITRFVRPGNFRMTVPSVEDDEREFAEIFTHIEQGGELNLAECHEIDMSNIPEVDVPIDDLKKASEDELVFVVNPQEDYRLKSMRPSTISHLSWNYSGSTGN